MLPTGCKTCGAGMVTGLGSGCCPKCLLQTAFSSRAARSPTARLAASVSQRFPAVLRSSSAYTVLARIACGGMGAVYKARQLSLRRVVAIKMLLDGPLATEVDLYRLRTEAELAARLQHPNIIAIHDLGEQEGQYYFCMDYIDGVTLSKLARARPLVPERAARYVRTVAEAMHYAHEHGVLHRDLKPSNIIIDGFDQPRITDFGLAKRLSAPQKRSVHSNPTGAPGQARVCAQKRTSGARRASFDLTLIGQVVGSPGYLSPEQASGQGEAVGPGSDVYSIGAMLYYLLTSRPPFSARDIPTTLRLVREAAPVRPRLLNARVPQALENICLTCLAKEPSHRYSSAQALAAALQSFLVGTCATSEAAA